MSADHLTADELLADLRDRLDRAQEQLGRLKNQRAAQYTGCEQMRLIGKIEGLGIVQDWLRSYG